MSGVSRRFRFGVLVSRAESLAAWRETARRAEALGYSTLLIADHFGQQLAPMPALVSAAEATSRLRVGTFVLDNDFRHPAAVAKEAATVDLLTDGRLELGIGAGWNAADYTQTGIPFDSAGTRISRLQEALHIIKTFFGGGDAGSSGGAMTFHGRHYQVDDLRAFPLPLQRPRPPILLGAAGRRMLTLAAREADILNFPDRPSHGVSTAGNPALGITFDEQMAIVRSAAGERYGQLELSALCIPRVTDDIAGTIEALATQMQTTPAIVNAMPGTMVGSLESIADKLQANRDQFDLSYAVIPGAALDALAPVVARLAAT